MTPRKVRTLQRFGDSGRGIAWLASRSARPLLGATETLGRERAMLGGLAWRRFVEWRSRAQALRRFRAGSAESANGAGIAPVGTATRTGASGQRGGRGDEWLEPILLDYFTRDGSTLMMRLLASSPQIAVEQAYPYERKYFAYLWRWSRILERGDWPADMWGPRAFGSLAQERRAALLGPPPWRPRSLLESRPGEQQMSARCFELAWREFSGRAARWTRAEHGDRQADVRYYAEKHLNTWLIDREELPQLRLIALLRDPRDTYVSINAFNSLRGNTGLGRDNAESDREHLYQLISRQRDRLRWIAGLLDAGEVPVIRYEDLVRDLPGVARKLEAWLGIELRPEAALGDTQVKRLHMSAKSPEESIGRWRHELDPEVAGIFADELAPELEAVGLER